MIRPKTLLKTKEDKTSTTCSVSTIVLDSDVPKDDNDLHLLRVPSPEERAAWIPKLQEMFPDVSATKLELTARTSTSLQEAVEEKCDTEGQESPPKVLTISDILFKLQSKVKGSDFTLAVREISHGWSSEVSQDRNKRSRKVMATPGNHLPRRGWS